MERTLEYKSRNKFILVLVITGVFIFTSFLLSAIMFKSQSQMETQEISVCGDGTLYGDCSKNKPYLCEKGILVERVSICGCSGVSLDLGGSCFSVHQSYPEAITLRYILNGTEKEIDFTVYGEMTDYLSRVSRAIEYTNGEQPTRGDFKLKTINHEEQRELLIPLVVKIQNLANESVDQARIAVSLVQNIPYGSTEETVLFASGQVDYSQYPYEVLYYGQGICGEKSTLMAFLLKELGYGVSIFYFSEENHEAVGIKCPVERSFKNSGYCFVETGGPSIITDSSMQYVNGIKLNSEPEVIVISEGISLPESMHEYKDAKTLKNIRSKNLIGLLTRWKFAGIKEKYGLFEEYQVE